MSQRIIVIFSLLVFLFTNLYSQENIRRLGVLKGTVLSAESREPLPFANVIIENTTFGGMTDTNGVFAISELPVGVYIVRVSLIGFTPSLSSDIVITLSKPTVLDILLTPANIEVNEVNVIADYFQKTPDANISTQHQSYEEIRQMPGGFEDVVRAISILPGVAQVQAGRNDLIVRGGAPSENLFLVDNLEVPNINHFGTQGASGGPLSFINLDFVQGTAFSSGGFGVKYGDKLSSVLSIDLRNGRTDRLGGKATLSATQFGLNIEGPVNENGSFLFSARRSYLDFIFKAAGFSFVPEYWDFLAKGDYRLDKQNRLSVLSIVALDGTKFFNDTPDKRYNNSRILGSNQDQFLGGVSWQHLFTSGYTLVTGGYQTTEYVYRQQDSLEQSVFSNDSRESEYYLSSTVVMQLSKQTEFSSGFQGKIVDLNTKIDLPTFRFSYGDSIASKQAGELSATKMAVYAQLSQQIAPVTITAGGRMDFYSLIQQGTKFSPRISASLALDSRTSVNLSLGRYYQSPSYIWLMANPLNRGLTPIRDHQYVIGIDHIVREDTKVSFEGYLKSYDNYPVSINRPYLTMANTGAGFGGADDGFASFGFDTLISTGTGEAHGVEFLLQKKISAVPCYGTLSISYNETRLAALDGIRRPGSFDQRWILNIGGGYVFNEMWEVSAKFRYATGRPYTPFNADGTQSGVLYNSLRVGTNHSLDIRADRRWLFDTWTLIAYIDITNVYNQKPVDVPRYDSRTKALKTNSSIGILPTIGVSAEF